MTRHRERRGIGTAAQVAVGALLVLGGTAIVLDTQVTKSRMIASQSCNVEAFEALQRNLIERAQVAADEREVDAALIRSMVSADGPSATSATRQVARARWIQDSDRLQRERTVRPYPPVRNCSTP